MTSWLMHIRGRVLSQKTQLQLALIVRSFLVQQFERSLYLQAKSCSGKDFPSIGRICIIVRCRRSFKTSSWQTDSLFVCVLLYRLFDDTRGFCIYNREGENVNVVNEQLKICWEKHSIRGCTRIGESSPYRRRCYVGRGDSWYLISVELAYFSSSYVRRDGRVVGSYQHTWILRPRCTYVQQLYQQVIPAWVHQLLRASIGSEESPAAATSTVSTSMGAAATRRARAVITRNQSFILTVVWPYSR